MSKTTSIFEDRLAICESAIQLATTPIEKALAEQEKQDLITRQESDKQKALDELLKKVK